MAGSFKERADQFANELARLSEEYGITIGHSLEWRNR